MQKVLIFIVFISTLSNSCNNSSIKSSSNLQLDSACMVLDSLRKNYFTYGNNGITEKLIIIEKKTGIESHATKGAFGYWYNADSTFLNDYKIWCYSLKCDCKYP